LHCSTESSNPPSFCYFRLTLQTTAARWMHCYLLLCAKSAVSLRESSASPTAHSRPLPVPYFSKVDRSHGILLSQVTYCRLQARPGLLQTAGTQYSVPSTGRHPAPTLPGCPCNCIDDKSAERFVLKSFQNSKVPTPHLQHPHAAIGRIQQFTRPLPWIGSFRTSFLSPPTQARAQ
jgi:hypothetical protein